MADKLTHQQEQAVFDRGGKLLVSAAAGSGKTKVLVDRLLSYMMDAKQPANLDEFLIITYTKAAASELRGKIAAKLTQRIAEDPENRHLQKQMQRLFLTKISTVHGFCADLIREYAYRLDIPADFLVADENECREIRELVLRDLLDHAYEIMEGNEDFLAFVNTQGLGRDDRVLPEIIEKVYDSAHCHLNPNGWLETCVNSADVTEDIELADTPWGQYLISDLHRYLDGQLLVMEQCAEYAQGISEFEKLAANLRDSIYQMQELRECSTWSEIRRKRDVEFARLSPVRKNPDPDCYEQIKKIRTSCKDGLKKKLLVFADDSDQILKDLQQSAAATRGLIALVKEFEKEFRQAKRKRRVLDFGDLEQLTLDLLLGKSRTGSTAAAAEIGRRYREIMVDEYQDSNGVQDAIFSALTQEKQNCFMVGDVKQSIYQFRLADPDIFLKKYKDFVPAENADRGQGRKVLLSSNFRSGPEIISGVNDVFYACMSPEVGGLHYGEDEALREGVPHHAMPEPAVELHGLQINNETYPEEAAFVAERIRDMLQNGTLVRENDGFRPVQPEDIVILLRSPGSVGRYFQRALETRGIRCTSGGGTDLLQTEEIATLRAVLQIIVNPRQDIPLVTALASPAFGFTADDLAAIRSGHRKGSFYDALGQSDMPKARQFLSLLQELRKSARMNTLTQVIEDCLQATHMDSIYAAMSDGDVKQQNIQTFFQLAADFEKGSLRNLGQFLEHLDTMENKGLISNGNSSAGCVTIMSIHKSKGLEFPVVFLCGLSRRFNQESIRGQILCDKELGLGLSIADNVNRIRYPSIIKRAIATKMRADSLSEEMRVLYVAMTRARDRLVMTYAAQNLEKDLQEASCWLQFGSSNVYCAQVTSMGEWILTAAIQRTEAGAFHALSGKLHETNVSEYPWKICTSQPPESNETVSAVAEQLIAMPENAEERLRASLGFQYGHIAATQTPSKQTATGDKGRTKDMEAAEDTQKPKPVQRSWRKASFVSAPISATTYGNAVHTAMQHIRYECCESVELVAKEVARLISEGFLKSEEGALVNCAQIANFFATEIGCKLRNGVSHIREFKFSILEDAQNQEKTLLGEQVLLQGVVDCALLEEDGITVVDFKTDYVTDESVDTAAVGYSHQVNAYGRALSRIYEMPIKAQYLYFFRLNRFIAV